MRKKLASCLVLGWVALGLSQEVFAGSYKVEVLVFTQKMPNTEVFEQTTNTLKTPQQVIEIATSNDPGQATVAAEPLSGLSSAYEQLSHQENYAVLIKTAWVQVVPDNQAIPAVHIQNADNTLNGYIALKAGGSLAMQVDVEYSQAVGENPKVYHVTEKQAVKPNEPHYFDHPAMGIITLVTPL
ncbi:MAG: CsiV family protein [Methylococcales bacterium]|nr:CsiV family protein [Methylococcales bacterium]